MLRASGALLLTLLSPLAHAEPLSLLGPALSQGQASLQAELGSYSGPYHSSSALLRGGYQTSLWNRLDAGVEAEALARLQGRAPAFAPGVQLSQGWLRWRAPYGFTAVAGRQTLSLGDGQFISGTPLLARHNQLDALWLRNNYLPETQLEYLGYQHPLSPLGERPAVYGHSLYAASRWFTAAQLNGLLQWQRQGASITRTAVLGINGDWGRARYQIRSGGQAQQGAVLPYALAELQQTYGPVSLQGQWRWLGGNGKQAVQTPLGAVSSGPLGIFATTPPQGLQEFALGLKAAPFSLQARHYRSSSAGQIFGTQLSARFSVQQGPCQISVQPSQFFGTAASRSQSLLALNLACSPYRP